MIKLIVFDLDGVLIDSVQLHKDTINQAITEMAGEAYIIGEEEHLARFNGSPTKVKLWTLCKEGRYPESKIEPTCTRKQELTAQRINELRSDFELIDICKY